MYSEAVSPDSVYAGLAYLNRNNFLYRDINVYMMCLPTSLRNLAEDKNTDTDDSIDSLESLLISNTPTSEELCIALEEEKRPNSLLADDN